MKEVDNTERSVEAKHLGYMLPPPPRDASPRRMFLCLLPSAIWIAAWVTFWMIENSFPNGDSRNFGGACLIMVMAPLGLGFGVMAVIEAFRPSGLRALAWGIGWNAIVALGPCITAWVLIHFGLFKHV